jgi:hypothetical protein
MISKMPYIERETNDTTTSLPGIRQGLEKEVRGHLSLHMTSARFVSFLLGFILIVLEPAGKVTESSKFIYTERRPTMEVKINNPLQEKKLWRARISRYLKEYIQTM